MEEKTEENLEEMPEVKPEVKPVENGETNPEAKPEEKPVESAEDQIEKKRLLKLRRQPNILITGTPGVGKSHICAKLAEKLQFQWLDVSKIAKEFDFVEEHDEEYDCAILDEDRLLDYLEPIINKGGNIVEFHGCELFPERWFHAVFVLSCDNTLLYDRLKNRGYNDKKLRSNIQCEILKTIREEARESYKANIIFELKGETPQDTENNMKIVRRWYSAWKRSREERYKKPTS